MKGKDITVTTLSIFKQLFVGDSPLFPVVPRFPSVLSLCLHLCRRLRLMRNERTGMLTAEDAHVAAADLLRRRNKEARRNSLRECTMQTFNRSSFSVTP